MAAIDVSSYEHSPVHKAIILKDYDGLRKIISELPQFGDPSLVQTESASIAEDAKADAIAAVLDRRDVPNRDTPLHLAVEFSDHIAAEMLLFAGADYSLQNGKGWDAFQDALCKGEDRIARIMIRHYEPLSQAKWCRRLPRLIGTMRRMRDFYMEIKFHFESAAIPFISRIAPSDTYKIWKGGANLRTDLTLDGLEWFRFKRSSKSFRFLGDGSEDGKALPGTLCVVSHKNKEVTYGLEGSATRASEAYVQHEMCTMTDVLRARISVKEAVLSPQMTWRRKEKTEMVGHWKAKVYDMHNVVLSYKSRKIPGKMDYDSESELDGILTEAEKKQLDDALKIDSNDDDIINQSATKHEKKGRFSGWRRKSNKESEKKNDPPRRSLSGEEEGGYFSDCSPHRNNYTSADPYPINVKRDKDEREREIIQEQYKKKVRPNLWLSSDFPLRIEEFLPLLDILANRVTAIRRLREYLSTELPQGTFPVKVSIPLFPTIRLVITFTKFEELKSLAEDFSTPSSNPAAVTRPPSSSRFRQVKSTSAKRAEDIKDPFAFPSDYTWITKREKKQRELQNEYSRSSE